MEEGESLRGLVRAPGLPEVQHVVGIPGRRVGRVEGRRAQRPAERNGSARSTSGAPRGRNSAGPARRAGSSRTKAVAAILRRPDGRASPQNVVNAKRRRGLDEDVGQERLRGADARGASRTPPSAASAAAVASISRESLAWNRQWRDFGKSRRRRPPAQRRENGSALSGLPSAAGRTTSAQRGLATIRRPQDAERRDRPRRRSGRGCNCRGRRRAGAGRAATNRRRA